MSSSGNLCLFISLCKEEPWMSTMSTLQQNVPKSKYMNKAMRLQIYKKYNWQHASAKLATMYTYSHIEGCWMGPWLLLHAIILAFGGFNPEGQTVKFYGYTVSLKMNWLGLACKISVLLAIFYLLWMPPTFPSPRYWVSYPGETGGSYT